MSKSSIYNEEIKKCLTIIEDRIGYGTISQWTHRNFESLSSEIEIKTGVLLSVSTLKRIWNSSNKSYPQKTTLDTLAQFIDYKDWFSFVSFTSKPTTKKIQINKILLASFIAILLILSIFYFINQIETKSDKNIDSKESELQTIPELVLIQEKTDSSKLMLVFKDSTKYD